MSLRFAKNLILFLFASFLVLTTISLVNYKDEIYKTNKELFYQSIYNEAKTHFLNLKIFRAWNSSYGGVYVKAKDGKTPNKYLKDNHLYSKDNELLIKINPAWMTKELAFLMNKTNVYKYNITSLHPMNPKNSYHNDFEKEALLYFEKNKQKDYFVKIDKKSQVFNFMGKLKVEKSCLSCHSKQNYSIGDVRGGISVYIPTSEYTNKLEKISQTHKKQISLIIVFSFIIFIVFYLVVNKVYKNQMGLKKIKDEYKLLYDRYDYAVNGANLGLWDWDIKNDNIFLSREWKSMLGYKDKELQNVFRTFKNMIHKDDRKRVLREIRENQRQNTRFYESTFRLKRKEGSYIWVLAKGQTFFDENKKAFRMVGFNSDITKKEQIRLRLSMLEKALAHAPVSIVITDVNGNIKYINPYFTKVSGYSFDEVFNENPRVLKSQFTTAKEYQELWNIISSKRTWRGTFKNKKKNGEEFWESAIITPILDEKDEQTVSYLAVKQEITKEIYLKEELRTKEEMMIAQSRHAAMGEMISMIAHQWRQPISVIAMSANNTILDIQLDEIDKNELEENSKAILEQTQYLSNTIEDFRNFFKPNKEKEVIATTSVLDESMKIIGKSLENHNIKVKIEIKSDKKVEVYSRELLQVFLNIIKNAKEVLENKDIENKLIIIKIENKGTYLRTSFYDNAGGINNEIKDKIFDPYFSTKDEKTGTGLGLYMSKTIVEKHLSGQLGFFNYNDGVIFYVDLPIKEN